MATVTGWMPVASTWAMLKASIPPENEIGRVPSKACDSFWASDRESTYRLRPDMYISSDGSSPAATSTGKVLVSFTPNRRPSPFARAVRRVNIATASPYCRSARKWWSSKRT